MKYKSGYKYIVAETLTIQSPYRPKNDLMGVCCGFVDLLKNGMLTIRKGYAWDGASGPAFDTKTIMRGSLFHDVSYQLMREGSLSRDLKDTADDWLIETCKEDGMWAARRAWVFWALDKFGSHSTEPESEPEIIEVP